MTSPVTLKDGRWERDRHAVVFVGTLRAIGDLNGDGAEEAAVLLAESTGGSGERVYLAVVGLANGRLQNLATALVGPHVKARRLRIADRAIVLDVVQVGQDDAMCCPSELATRTFVLQGKALQERPVTRTGKLTLETVAGTEWTLRKWSQTEDAPAEPGVTLRFEGGRFAGRSGCNQYSAAAKDGSQAGLVTVSVPVATRMACSEPAMTVETRFLRQLQAVTSYTFIGGQLALTYADGRVTSVMVFEQ